MSTSPMSMRTQVVALSLLLLAVLLWSYWPTLCQLVDTWSTQADYSHGFLVIPISLVFLWFRRDQRPGSFRPHLLGGVSLFVVSLAMRIVGVRYSFDSLDGYSLVIWSAGLIVLFGGSPAWRWAWPAVIFWLFMVPLPFRLEQLLSVPLQYAATQISCFVLQCLGQPAFAEGTTIVIGVHQLSVAQECSGLRMFLGSFAMAFAFLILLRREIWEQTILLLAVVPVALIANAARIVATAIAYQIWGDGADIVAWCHDMAGMLMIPLAAALFAGVLVYLSRLLPVQESVRMADLMARGLRDH